MQLNDAIDLIRDGVESGRPQRWADLGCGNGLFTIALAELLPPGSEIFAFDLKPQRLVPAHNDVSIYFQQLDFVKEPLPNGQLDGVLMANSLHYINDQASLIQRLLVPQFIFVEYEHRSPNPWVPFPVPSARLTQLLLSLGYSSERLSEKPSQFGGQMYSMAAVRS
jgi:SAM-dependent methyltransferase